MLHPLIISRGLVHWNMHATDKDVRNVLLILEALFELEILVPERVGEEIVSDRLRCPLEQPRTGLKCDFVRGEGR